MNRNSGLNLNLTLMYWDFYTREGFRHTPFYEKELVNSSLSERLTTTLPDQFLWFYDDLHE